MNGPVDVFAKLLQKVRPETREVREMRMRIQRETYEVVTLIEQAMTRGKNRVHIGPHYCLDVMRALALQCEDVEPVYRLKQTNREDNYLMGYVLKWTNE